jgi:hypothetical protein
MRYSAGCTVPQITSRAQIYASDVYSKKRSPNQSTNHEAIKYRLKKFQLFIAIYTNLYVRYFVFFLKYKRNLHSDPNDSPEPVSSVYNCSENSVQKSEAKDGGN